MNSGTVVGAFLLCLHIQVIAVALPFRTVALSGEPAPGTPPGTYFTGFYEGVLNEYGTVVFNAFVGGPGVIHTHPSNAYGIWRDDAGALTKVVRSGEQAVGLPAGTNYYLPGPPRIDGQGRTAFPAEAPGQSTHGVFSEGHGELRLLARETNQVPGLSSGITFYLFSIVPLMNDAGDVVFTSFIRGPGLGTATEALFTDRSGPLEVVIKEGDNAPGMPGARILQIGGPVINDLGVIALSGRYTGGVFPNDHAIWAEQAGALSLVVRSGQAPGGMQPGVVFGRLENPRINNAGQLMFLSTLTGPGISSDNDAALWLNEGDEFELIAREGTAAAGIAAGTKHGGISRAYLNGAGAATFVGSLTGPDMNPQNDTAVWSQRGGSLALIAREGNPAPGAPVGVTFGDFSRLGGGHGFQVNDLGQVAFEVTLTGPGITTANDMGIWVTDLTGALRLVAREGDLFDVNDDPTIDDLRTVRSTDLQWYSGGGEDGYASAFNNLGELAISLTFTDNSGGAFVIHTTVPEPSIGMLVATAFSFMWFRRRYGLTYA